MSMKKVICTYDERQIHNGTHQLVHLLSFGEKYTVIDVLGRHGKEFYILAEFGHAYAFEETYFSPCSDIDETELFEERLTEEDAVLKALAEACPDVVFPEESKRRLWARIEEHLNAPL